MSVKLNSFILPDNIIKKMEEQIEKTRNTKIEQGFNLCEHNGNIIEKDECTGDTCEIRIKSECSNQDITPKVGDFHTHPRGGSKMSLADLKNACHHDLKCIGSIDNSIICFVKKNVPYPEGCSIEIDNIISSTEEIGKETTILKRERSTLEESKDNHNIDMKKYRELDTEIKTKVKQHNENVSNLIERKYKIIDKYFKEIVVR